MTVFHVLADSSCLIGLAKINLFHVLRELFSEIYIPGAVYEEVVIKGAGEAGSKEIEAGIKDGWMIRKAVNAGMAVSALTTRLGKGESEVIILCKEVGLDYALIDERTARNIADLLNVNTLGVLGIMDLAIEKGFAINKKKAVGQLKELGFRISDKLYNKMFSDPN